MALIAPGLTLDTGALIALERGEKRMRAAVLRAEQLGMLITVPAVVIGEWWRGGTGRQRAIIESVDVEPVSEELGKLAGEAVAAMPGASVVGMIVMASAAQRGDVVYTSDVGIPRAHARALRRCASGASSPNSVRHVGDHRVSVVSFIDSISAMNEICGSPPHLRSSKRSSSINPALGRFLRISAPTLPDGRYLHWDDLRRRPPPQGLTKEQWWAAQKFGRLGGRVSIPSFVDTHGEPFWFCRLDAIDRATHQLDRRDAVREMLKPPAMIPCVSTTASINSSKKQ